jgi:hypothetical protein
MIVVTESAEIDTLDIVDVSTMHPAGGVTERATAPRATWPKNPSPVLSESTERAE